MTEDKREEVERRFVYFKNLYPLVPTYPDGDPSLQVTLLLLKCFLTISLDSSLSSVAREESSRSGTLLDEGFSNSTAESGRAAADTAPTITWI